MESSIKPKQSEVDGADESQIFLPFDFQRIKGTKETWQWEVKATPTIPRRPRNVVLLKQTNVTNFYLEASYT